MSDWCRSFRAQKNGFEIVANSRGHLAVPLGTCLRETDRQLPRFVKTSFVLVCLFPDSDDNISLHRRIHLLEESVLEFLLIQKSDNRIEI